MTKQKIITSHPKPSWTDATATAQWLAMNMYGEWDFFDKEPSKFKGYWINNGTVIIGKRRDPSAPTFDMIKEKRPDFIEHFYRAPEYSYSNNEYSDEEWVLASEAEDDDD